MRVLCVFLVLSNKYILILSDYCIMIGFYFLIDGYFIVDINVGSKKNIFLRGRLGVEYWVNGDVDCR